nr:histidine kinase [Nocardiopsis mwathae]
MAVAQAHFSGDYVDIAYTTVSTLITGLIVYGLSRLQELVRQLHDAQRQLAETAVTRERLRFARDLHDLLGYSLSSITLRTELAHKLVLRQPQRARDELEETLRTSRQALADVRTVAHGYRELSLDQECRSVRSVLVAAEVELRMRTDYGDLPARVSTVAATVLREGVTNLLRHSKAENCEITVVEEDGEVAVEIVNDGIDGTLRQSGPRSGSGLHNLSERVQALGGLLTAGADGEGRFRLGVRLPLRQEEHIAPPEHSAAA